MKVRPPLEEVAVWTWRAILAFGIAWELRGLVRRGAGDTLSELVVHRAADYVWFHGALLGFMFWLLFHWQLIGDPRDGLRLNGLTAVLIFVTGGILAVQIQRILGLR